MILVNEIIRQSKEKMHFSHYGIMTINSNTPILNTCTWLCHDNTSYCIKHHVNLLKLLISFINPIYNGIIVLLRSTGNYGFANILFLVLVWPLLLVVLAKKVMDNHQKIKLLKNKKWKQ